MFDGRGSTSSEVYVEQGSGSMGRRKRSMAATVYGDVSASHEPVLTRHLLAFKDGSKHLKESDELEGSQLDSEALNWSQSVSILTILAAVVVIALVMLSVIFWFRRRQQSSHPC